MEHSISEVAMKLEFPSTTIIRVYIESGEFSKTSNLRHCYGRKKIVQDRNELRRRCIIKGDISANISQNNADFNDGPSTSDIVQTIERIIIDIGFRAEGPFMGPW